MATYPSLTTGTAAAAGQSIATGTASAAPADSITTGTAAAAATATTKHGSGTGTFVNHAAAAGHKTPHGHAVGTTTFAAGATGHEPSTVLDRIAYRAASSSYISTLGASQTIAFPGTPKVGDPIGIWITGGASGTTCTPPAGWTVEYNTTVGTGARIFVHKKYATSDGTGAVFVFSAQPIMSVGVIVFDGSVHSDIGVLGTITTRGASSTTTIAVATGSPTHPNLVVSHEKTTSQTTITPDAGLTAIISQIPITGDAGSLFIGAYDDSTATAQHIITYGLTANTNGAAYQVPISLLAAVNHGSASGTFKFSGTDAGHKGSHGTGVGAPKFAATATGHSTSLAAHHGSASGTFKFAVADSGHKGEHGTAARTFSFAAVAAGHMPATGGVAAWLASARYIAHRGGDADNVQDTAYAYQQAAAWNSAMALEVSVVRTSDGYYMLSDSLTTGAAYNSNLTIGSSTKAQLAALRTTTGNYPPMFLDSDIVPVYGGKRVIFLDCKNSSTQAATELRAITDANGGPSWWVYKGYYSNTAWYAQANSGGYQSWGYWFPADTAAGNLTSANVAHWTMLGIEYDDTSAIWTQALSYGKLVFAHIIATAAQASTANAAGANGLMVSGVREVVPTDEKHGTGAGTFASHAAAAGHKTDHSTGASLFSWAAMATGHSTPRILFGAGNVTTSNTGANTGSTVTTPIPANTQVGDLLLWIVSCGASSNQIPGPPTGWSGLATSTTVGANYRLLAKIATSADITAGSATTTGTATGREAGIMIRGTGFAAVPTVDVVDAETYGTAVSSPQAVATLTTTVPDILLAWCILNQAAAPAVNFSMPSGWAAIGSSVPTGTPATSTQIGVFQQSDATPGVVPATTIAWDNGITSRGPTRMVALVSGAQQPVKHGAAVGTFVSAGAASGHRVDHGAAVGTFRTAGASAGHHASHAHSTPTVNFNAHAQGHALKHGAAAGTFKFTGVALANGSHHGHATAPTFLFHGIAGGTSQRHGHATVNGFLVAGHSTGERKSDGHGTLGAAWHAVAQGHATHHSAATGAVRWASASRGHTARDGHVTASITWHVAAAGHDTRHGAAAGLAVRWAIGVVGHDVLHGGSALSVRWTAHTAGHAPYLPPHEGHAAPPIVWHAFAAGHKTSHGAATVLGTQWEVGADGITDRFGSSASSTLTHVSATGRNTVGYGNANLLQVVWSVVASGEMPPERGDHWVSDEKLWFEVNEDPMLYVAALRSRGLVQPTPDWRPRPIPKRVLPFGPGR